MAVFLGNPAQNFPTAVIVEIDIDIGKGYTVGVEEAFEQQIVFNWVYLRDTQTIRDRRSGGRTTAGTHRYAHVASGGDKVLHDEEVSRETHRFHDVQLEDDTFFYLFVERISVSLVSSVVCQLFEIVGFEFNSIQFVIPAQNLDFFLGCVLGKYDVSVFVLCKFVEKVFFGIFFTVFFFCTEVGRNFKCRHDRCVVDAVCLDFVAYLDRIGESLGHIAEYSVHFFGCLQPFLFRVTHVRVTLVYGTSRIEANEAFVGIGVFFIYKMHVVGTNELYPEFLSIFQ